VKREKTDPMKITSGVCDIHPTIPLALARVTLLSPLGDVNHVERFCCTHPGCVRTYDSRQGYFDAPLNERPIIGDLASKPRCGWRHPLTFMVLTRMDGVLKWACPVHECTITEPQKLMSLDEVQHTLKHHEYMWFRKGTVALGGDVIGYSKIPGRKIGQEIWINNYGTVERPNWRCKAYQDGTELFCNTHFETPEAAFYNAFEGLASTNRLPTVRLFRWHGGHVAYTVDGFTHETEILIVETTPGEFRMQISVPGRTFWMEAVWSSLEDVLRF
jgi:hypothetical protein